MKEKGPDGQLPGEDSGQGIGEVLLERAEALERLASELAAEPSAFKEAPEGLPSGESYWARRWAVVQGMPWPRPLVSGVSRLPL